MPSFTYSEKELQSFINDYGIENLINNSYLHTRKETAQYGIKLANSLLTQKIGSGRNRSFTDKNILTLWNKEIDNISAILKSKERKLLNVIKPGLKKQDFKDAIDNIQLGGIYDEMDYYIKGIESFKRGKKTYTDAQDWNNKSNIIISKLNEYIKENSLANNKDNVFVKLTNQITNLNNDLSQSIKDFDNRTNKKNTVFKTKNAKSISIYYFTSQVFSKYLEEKAGIIIERAINKLNDRIVTNISNTSGNTKRNTSEDRKIDLLYNKGKISFSVSVKTSSKNILQEKKDKISTLLKGNVNQNINGTLSNILSSSEFNDSKIQDSTKKRIEYILSNYVINKNVDKKNISDAIKVIVLAYMNEKIFGYNKTGQEELKLTEIINKIPLVTYSNSGIHFLSDVIKNVKNEVNNNISKITQLYKNYTIDKVDMNNVKTIKGEIFKKLKKKGEEYNYNNIIKEWTINELEKLKQNILSQASIKIQYSIPYVFA